MNETPPQKLTRSSSDRVIGGVAGGLARQLGIDPIIVRVVFVVVTLLGGAGLLAYLALLIFVPDDEGKTLAPPSKAGIALAVIAGLVAIATVFGDGWDFGFPFGALAFALVLLAAGAVLLRAAGSQDHLVRRLGRMAVMAGSLILSVILGLAAGLAAALGAGVAVAAVVVACGLGLMLAAFAGGARWLIVPALILATPLTVVAAADLRVDGGIGERTYRPASLGDLRDSYELGIGELRVDLRDVELPPGETVVKVKLGIGSAQIAVREDTCVAYRIKIGAGESRILGADDEGIDVDLDGRPRVPVSTPVLVVDGDIGLGEIVVDEDDRSFLDDRHFDFSTAGRNCTAATRG